jgi:AraC-like DNA-binding protein
VSAPDILANMSRGWNRDPAGVALGTERTGVSAALWTHEIDNVQEVWAEPDPACHILTLMMTDTRLDLERDGRLWVSGHDAERGSIQCVPVGQRPRAVTYGRFKLLHFYVPCALLADLSGYRSGALDVIDPLYATDAIIERIGRDVLAEMREGQPLSRLRVDALGQDLAIQLLRRWSNLTGTRTMTQMPAKGGLAPWQERRTTEYLRAHLTRDVSLHELAGVAQLSAFHFARTFKQSMGLPPHAFLRRLRCERAKELLTATDLPVTEIAAQVGYETPQAFARMFRAEVGASPGEYRRGRR